MAELLEGMVTWIYFTRCKKLKTVLFSLQWKMLYIDLATCFVLIDCFSGELVWGAILGNLIVSMRGELILLLTIDETFFSMSLIRMLDRFI